MEGGGGERGAVGRGEAGAGVCLRAAGAVSEDGGEGAGEEAQGEAVLVGSDDTFQLDIQQESCGLIKKRVASSLCPVLLMLQNASDGLRYIGLNEWRRIIPVTSRYHAKILFNRKLVGIAFEQIIFDLPLNTKQLSNSCVIENPFAVQKHSLSKLR